jgi:hypothetical protein
VKSSFSNGAKISMNDGNGHFDHIGHFNHNTQMAKTLIVITYHSMTK